MATNFLCSIAGCDKPSFSRGWCAGHYHRWRKHGDPMGGRHARAGCLVLGCENKHHSHGYCGKHVYRLQAHGDALCAGDQTKAGEPLQWLVDHSKHDDEEACLPWPFGLYPHGYGHVTYEGRDTTAHRVMCFLAHGEPPQPDFDAAHSCHNRRCCNPRHLRWATKTENQADRGADGTKGVGAMNGATKISEEDVRKIRAMRGSLEQAEIARIFGITKSNVSAIQLRKSWAWLD